jgi:HEAT repeats
VLQGLDAVPWADLEHAHGSAADVPDLLRELLDPDPKVRSEVLSTLYSNVFHQGTRFPVAPYVVPFLIELCANSVVPNRGDLLRYWGNLIAGYFSVQERPCWGDGERIYLCGEVQQIQENDPYPEPLHEIYRESLKGHELLCDLLSDEDSAVRAGAAWVLACLPTKANASVPSLNERLAKEPSEWVRATMAFALGELGAAVPLRRILTTDPSAVPRCMAVCQLARIDPSDDLLEPLLHFVSQPIEWYDQIPGAGGKSTGDAAYSISHLPSSIQRQAIPAICNRLDQARSIDTMPLVRTLLSAAFPKREEPLTELTDLQRQVLIRMVNTEELWSVAMFGLFRTCGLTQDREKCAQLAGVKVADDEALRALRLGLAFADLGFLDKGCEGILKAFAIDPAVLERTPAPDECWLLCAKAFAESDPERSIAAFRCAIAINPGIAHRVNPTWPLADLLKENGFG